MMGEDNREEEIINPIGKGERLRETPSWIFKDTFVLIERLTNQLTASGSFKFHNIKVFKKCYLYLTSEETIFMSQINTRQNKQR